MYDNTVTIQESQSGPTIYTPTAGQPSFSTDSPLGDSFRIFSTPGHRLDALDARRRHYRARLPPLENVRSVTLRQHSGEIKNLIVNKPNSRGNIDASRA